MMNKISTILMLSFFALFFLQSCTVVKIIDVAASTAIGVTKGAVKVTGKAVGAVIPGGDDDEDKGDDEDTE